MKSQITFIFLCLALLQACSGNPDRKEPPLPPAPPSSPGTPFPNNTPQINPLFIAVAPPKNINATQNPTIIRSRFVEINFDLLESGQPPPDSRTRNMQFILLNLFEDATYQAILDRIESSSPESFTWIGHIEGIKKSQVTLVVENKIMSGNITLPELFYQVRYVDGGVHVIYQINQSAFPND